MEIKTISNAEIGNPYPVYFCGNPDETQVNWGDMQTKMHEAWREASKRRGPDMLLCLPDTYEAYQRIINAPRWKKVLWKLTFGHFPR